MDGVLVVDKPAGMTSHDVVDEVRKRFRMRRVGHAGTLDPMATGVLVVLVGRSTKLFNKFVAFDKAYRATLRLGVKTTTADMEGKPIEEKPYEDIFREQVETIFKDFVGEIQQIPPMVSAVKYKGKRLYKLARKGVEVEREPRTIHVHSLKLLDFSPPLVEFYIECSKGTYVRKLAEDVGDALGCGACIAQIQRTGVGPFRLSGAVGLQQIDESHVQQWDRRNENYTRHQPG